jgi:ketosteroid isomerase-like protein
MEAKAIARALFDAFAQGDSATVRKLCAASVAIRQNQGEAMDLDTLLAFTSQVLSVVNNFRYEDVICRATESGFVEEHLVRGNLADGQEISIAACVVGEISDGKITSLSETLDSVAAGPLIEALQPA